MTEQEFVRQVWRAFDTVEIEGGIKSKVLNVCFTTHSVRIRLANGVPDWVRCELIIKHTSGTAETEDAGIIEDLHNNCERQARQNLWVRRDHIVIPEEIWLDCNEYNRKMCKKQ